MKKFRAITAGILASAMAMTMTAGFAAFAAPSLTDPGNITKTDDTYTVSVIKTANDKAAHKYEAYQIFTADVDDDTDQLTITGWGAGVNSAKLLAAIKAESAFVVDDVNLFADAADAADVAAVLAKFEQDGPQIQAFAKAVGGCLGTPVTEIGTADTAYTDIEVGTAGYYLIKEEDNSLESKHSAMTRYILTPTNTINPTAKADFPTIDKKILENGVKKEANTVSIGDTVTYQLDSKVPDMTGYNKYFYIVNDSMFKGLTLDPETIKIKIGNTELKAKDFYYKDVADTKEDYDDFEIVFVNFIQYLGQKGDNIVITYDAILNTDANIGATGNPNVVDLTFSNDPNHKYEGTPENPDTEEPEKPDEPNPGTPDDPNTPDVDESKPGDPMGKTPEHKVITYTAGIDLIKVDSANQEKQLAGAKFQITGNGVNTVVILKAEFVEDAAGSYYLLKDGTYTETAPTSATEDKYESTTTKYKKTGELVKETQESPKNVELTVDNDGVLRVRGLGDGEYTITETKAPEGYILKDGAITVTIESTPELTGCTWKFNGTENTTGIYEFKVTNPKGVVLPGTGAFGSKLMYALGTLFTGAGVAYVISKKKSKNEEE